MNNNRTIKVLMYGYSTCCQNDAGGVQTRIRKIYDLLNETPNCVCDLFNPFSSKLKDYDILHIFMLNSESYNLALFAKSIGVRVVISTIVSLKTGIMVDLHRILFSFLPILTTYKMMIETAKIADCLIVETEKEKRFIKKHYRTKNKIIVIPNGVDENDSNSNFIFDIIGSNKKYVLIVGRFDKNKNQLRLIKALRGTKVNLVLIGGPDKACEDYYQQCLEAAKGFDNVFFTGWLDSASEIIKSAYKNAEVVVSASFNETFGMTIIEGGAAGAKLCISCTLPILEFECFQDCLTFKPNNIKDIRKRVLMSFELPNDGTLKQRVLNYFSWSRLKDEHLDLYRSLLIHD